MNKSKLAGYSSEGIKTAYDFNSLKLVLSSLPKRGIQGEDKFYRADDLIDLIDQYQEGKITDLNVFPNAYGLKDKMGEFAEKINKQACQILECDGSNRSKILYLLSNYNEEGDNSELLINIINTYGKEGIDIIFKQEGLEYFYTYSYQEDFASIDYLNTQLENAESEQEKEYILETSGDTGEYIKDDLSETSIIKYLDKYIPSLVHRQYLCDKFLIEAGKTEDAYITEGYLMCCENSELYVGHEKHLVSFLYEVESYLNYFKLQTPQIIASMDLNKLISIVKIENSQGNIIDLNEFLKMIFEGYKINNDALNDESVQILSEAGIL